MEIYGRLRQGESIFLTGSAGTGKTYTTRRILEANEGSAINIIQAATTGVAAINLPDGNTLHSHFMLPVKEIHTVERWIGISRKLMTSKSSRIVNMIRKTQQAHILLIDEISMCSAWLFEYLSLRLSVWRKDNRPFGGIRLLLVGDFYQLPPVYDTFNTVEGHPRQRLYCYESPLWKAAGIKIFKLEKIYRQQDEGFATICNKLREGTPLDPDEFKRLESRRGEAPKDAMKIMVKRDDVFKINDAELKALQTPNNAKKFPFIKLGDNMQLLNSLERDARQSLYIPYKVDHQNFKVGAKVLLTINASYGEGPNKKKYVNGDRGTIVGFTDQVGEDLQEYKGPENMPLTGHAPIVRFERTQDLVIVFPHVYQRNEMVGRTVVDSASITAFPICLAWASTVHKAQGSNISTNLHLDCRMMDENIASFYVAISRSTDLNKITMSNFTGVGVASRKVTQFYEGTYQVQDLGILELFQRKLNKVKEEKPENIPDYQEWKEVLNKCKKRSMDKVAFVQEVMKWARMQ